MAKQADALDLGSSTHHGYVGSNPTEGTQRQKDTASIAQLVEQRTFNPWVQGSSPCGGTETSHQQPLTNKKDARMSIHPPIIFSTLTTPFNRLAIGTVVEDSEGNRYMKTYCDGFNLWIDSNNIECAHDDTWMLGCINAKPDAWLIWV